MLSTYDVVRWFIRSTAMAGMLLCALGIVFWLLSFLFSFAYGGFFSLPALFIYILLWFFSDPLAAEMVGSRQVPALSARELTPLTLSCAGLVVFLQGATTGVNSFLVLGWQFWFQQGFGSSNSIGFFYRNQIVYALLLCVLGFFMTFGPRILVSFAANKQPNLGDGPYSDISKDDSPEA